MPAEPTTAQVRRNKKEVDEFPFKVSGHAREIEQKRARGTSTLSLGPLLF